MKDAIRICPLCGKPIEKDQQTAILNYDWRIPSKRAQRAHWECYSEDVFRRTGYYPVGRG